MTPMASQHGGPRGPAATGWRGDPDLASPSGSTAPVDDVDDGVAVGRANQSMAALRRAGPLAFAGVAANAANVIVTGTIAQLLVLFLLLSMPGSALLVAVVRRVTAWSMSGQADRIKPWVTRLRRWGFVGLALLALVAWLSRGWLATLLALPSPAGVAEVLIAGGAWGLLSF